MRFDFKIYNWLDLILFDLSFVEDNIGQSQVLEGKYTATEFLKIKEKSEIRHEYDDVYCKISRYSG